MANKTVWVESVGAYVSMPVSYDPAKVTSDDVSNDSALRTLTRAEAEEHEASLDESWIVEARIASGASHWSMEPECRFTSREDAEREAKRLRRAEPRNDEGARLEYRVVAE